MWHQKAMLGLLLPKRSKQCNTNQLFPVTLNPKKARRGARGASVRWPYGFSKNQFSCERLKPCFLWLLRLSEVNFTPKISLKFIESFRSYEDFFFDFNYFRHFFKFFWHFLITKKKNRITSAYRRWCHQVFGFNLLQIRCLTNPALSVLND